jgi:hypothetical protein
VASRSCARMSHILGVNVTRRIMVSIFPEPWRRSLSIPGLHRTCYPGLGHTLSNRHQSIAAFCNQMIANGISKAVGPDWGMHLRFGRRSKEACRNAREQGRARSICQAGILTGGCAAHGWMFERGVRELDAYHRRQHHARSRRPDPAELPPRRRRQYQDSFAED